MRIFSKPQKLYKYLSTDGAEKLFASSDPSLWFRLSNKLNDVYDMRPVGSSPFGNQFGSIAVLCLSETPTSCPMWAHYGSNGEGIVLEFSTGADFFAQYPPLKVRYQSKRPTVRNPKAAATTKSKEWAYEREWRCFTVPPERHAQKEQFLSSEQAVSVPFPFAALTAVIHGIDSQVDASPLLNRAEAKHVRELVCRTDPWSYALNIHQLDDMSHLFENQAAAMWGHRQK